MNKKYVPIERIRYELSKIRKSSNFNYRKAIERNKRNQAKSPPLINLLTYLNNNNYKDKDVNRIVSEYWSEVEKNKYLEKDIEKKLKMKYARQS